MHILTWQSLRADSLLEPQVDIRGTAVLGTFHRFLAGLTFGREHWSRSFPLQDFWRNLESLSIQAESACVLWTLMMESGLWSSVATMRVNTSKPESRFLCWKIVQGSKFGEFKYLRILFTSYSQVTRRWWSARWTGNSGGLLIYVPLSPPLMGYG